MNLSSSSALLDALLRGDLTIDRQPFPQLVFGPHDIHEAKGTRYVWEKARGWVWKPRHLLPVQPPPCPVCEGSGKIKKFEATRGGGAIAVPHPCPDCKGSGFYTGKLILTVPGCNHCLIGYHGDCLNPRSTYEVPNEDEDEPAHIYADRCCCDSPDTGQRVVASAVVERWLPITPCTARPEHLCFAPVDRLLWHNPIDAPWPDGETERDLSHLASVADWFSYSWAGVLTEVETL